jgi:hypothetical protein
VSCQNYTDALNAVNAALLKALIDIRRQFVKREIVPGYNSSLEK